MQRKPQVAAAIAALAVLGACADATNTTARVTEPEVLANFVSVATSCTNSAYSSYRRSALDYSSLRNDPVGDMFGVLSKASTDAARKSAAMDILARLDEIRSTGLSKLAADGGRAAAAAIGCGKLLPEASVPTDAQMAAAMDLGAQGGVFEVVGGATDTRTGAAVAANAAPSSWGAEPYNTGVAGNVSTWATAFPAERVLLYAFRIPTLTGFEGIPLDPSSSVAFDMSTAPLIDPVANSVNIFVCAGDDFSRIQSRQFIMSPWTPRYCNGGTALSSNTESLGSRLLAWVSPSPLFASSLLIGTGGVKSGWSPKGLVKPLVNSFVIELVQPLADVSLSDVNGGTFNVVVKAYALANGTQFPTGDIEIRVNVAGNNGLGNDGSIPEAIGYTNDDGIATIPFNTGKTGAFTLRIDGYFVNSGIPVTIVSAPFNVRP